MADSSSESETSFNIEEVPEDNRDHVREVLAKGRQIAPFYNVPLYWLRTMFSTDFTKATFKQTMCSIMSYRLLATAARCKTMAKAGLRWARRRKRQRGKNMTFLRTSNVIHMLNLVIWRAHNWEKEEAKQRHPRNPRNNADRNNNSAEGFGPKYREKDHSQPTGSHL